MASVTLATNWDIQLSPAETRLVLKALGGRLTTEEDRKLAKLLGDELTTKRFGSAKSLYEQMSKNNDNIEN